MYQHFRFSLVYYEFGHLQPNPGCYSWEYNSPDLSAKERIKPLLSKQDRADPIRTIKLQQKGLVTDSLHRRITTHSCVGHVDASKNIKKYAHKSNALSWYIYLFQNKWEYAIDVDGRDYLSNHGLECERYALVSSPLNIIQSIINRIQHALILSDIFSPWPSVNIRQSPELPNEDFISPCRIWRKQRRGGKWALEDARVPPWISWHQ